MLIGVQRDSIRVEVSDEASTAPHLTLSRDGGGDGADREGGRNLTWFELDLPAPGA